ncbi:hypothetical protein RLPCCGM1_p0021 [Rhizobium leguminosarum bv. phaseoli CCGM1]|nr:hypothetical protein RLPCCGM1_p0021 [Rhizobium leguminosarum bv. phaseoli CCGM1]
MHQDALSLLVFSLLGSIPEDLYEAFKFAVIRSQRHHLAGRPE